LLSILIGEQPDIFKAVLDFYCPKGKAFLDITYGHGKLWTSIDPERYDVLATNDVNPESLAHNHFRIGELPDHFDKNKYDAIIYDPPYKYNKSSYILFGQKDDRDWRPRTTLWQPKDQVKSAGALNVVAPILLGPEGTLIVKIMDTRLEGKLILNDKIIIDNLTNFTLFDRVVYIRNLVGIFRQKKVAQTAHGFYLIFKRRELLRGLMNL